MPAGGFGLLVIAILALAFPLGLYLLVRDESERNRTSMDRRDAERTARRDAGQSDRRDSGER